MWKVKQNGCTDHFSGCNFAARKETFQRFGLFDESFHLGGEDSELCRRWHLSGVKIKYCPHVLIYHEPRQDFDTFIKWMFYRGRSNYYLKKKIGDVSGLIGVRVRSTLRIIMKNLFDAKLPMIIVLHAFSFAVQQIGYFYEKGRSSKRKTP
jgi:GT2 family glycosyltransferase